MNKNFIIKRYCEIECSSICSKVCRSSQHSMTVFRNFKNQSQFQECSRLYLGKTITAFYDYIWLIMYRNKNTEILQGEVQCTRKQNNKRLHITKMDKQWLRVALKVLDEVKIHFPDTKQFIEDLIDKECQKQKTSVDEVIFFTSPEAKSQPRKTFFILQ